MNYKNPTLLSQRIKVLRKEANMLQSELGQKLGVTTSSISNYESGKTLPPIDKIKEMAEIFGVPIDYLTGDSDSRAFRPEKLYIDVDNYIGELIRAIEGSENTLKYNGLPIPRDAKEILQMNLEHTLQVLHRQLETTFRDILKQ